MSYEKVDFPRALEVLSEYSGIPLLKQNSDQSFKTELFKMNEVFLDYFQKNLWGTEGLAARDYLHSRGLGESEIKRFELGYSLAGFENYTRQLLKKPEDISRAIQLGLAKQRENSRDLVYDFYRDRIIFPIRDASGKVAGFGGRVFKETQEAKYINSPASPVYDKGKMFYGLFQAANSIRRERKSILVEGYLDVIGMHSKGLDIAIAPLGTALTPFQVRAIKNYSDKIIILLDGDNAGKRAAVRASEVCIKENLQAEVVLLENGLDPFDLTQSKTKAEINEILQNMIPVTSFFLKETMFGADKASPSDIKRKALESLFAFVKTLERETDQQMYLSEGARALGLGISAVINDFQKGTKISFGVSEVDSKQRGNLKENSPVKNARVQCERKIISLILLRNDLFSLLNDKGEIVFQDQESAFMQDMIINRYQNSEVFSTELLQEVPDSVRSAITPHVMDSKETLETEEQEKFFKELVLRLWIFEKKEEMESLSNNASDRSADAFQKLMNVKNEILILEQEIRSQESRKERV
jgi:DNA primase